jgi:hypothetical protein
MCRLLVLAAVVLALAPISVTQVHDPCRNAVLPTRAQSLIAHTFTEWRTKRVSDLGTDDQQLWTKAHPAECPGVAAGHFQEPDLLAYALVLVPKSDANAGYMIVVLSRNTTSEDYAVKILDHAKGPRSGAANLVVSRLRPGTYPNFDGTKSLRLKLDTINVEWIEAAAVVYYWASGQYRTLQTAD